MNKTTITAALYPSLIKYHSTLIGSSTGSFENLPFAIFRQEYEGHCYEVSRGRIFVFHIIEESKLSTGLFIIISDISKISQSEIKECVQDHLSLYLNTSFFHILFDDEEKKIRGALSELSFKSSLATKKYFLNRNPDIEKFLAQIDLDSVSKTQQHGFFFKQLSQLEYYEMHSIAALSRSSLLRLIPTRNATDFLISREQSEIFIQQASYYLFDSKGRCLAICEGIRDVNNYKLVRFEIILSDDFPNAGLLKVGLDQFLMSPLLMLLKSSIDELQILCSSRDSVAFSAISQIADAETELDIMHLSRSVKYDVN